MAIELTDEMMAKWPPDAQALVRLLSARVAELEAQVVELRSQVTEYQRHRLLCACGSSTCGNLPPGVPTGQAGPRLIAFSGLLMACFRQSKRRAAQFLSMILNQPASAAWMVLLQNRCADAVQPAYDELAARLPAQETLNIDESPTKQGPAKAWVWTVVATTFTFFACRTSRAATVLQNLLGEAYDGIIHCDRARMYWQFGRLQWCWAHLKRDFQALVDDPCRTKQRLGRDLLRPTKKLFALWKRYRDGTIQRDAFERRLLLQSWQRDVDRDPLLARRQASRSPHAEPSWAEAIPLAAACDIGLRFQQDAVYYVADGRLSVSYCDERRGLVLVDDFRSRLQVTTA